MTAYDFTDKTKSYYNGGTDKHTLEDNVLTVSRAIIDFSKQNLGATDSAQVLDIEAGSMVLQVGIRCITADANANYDVGDDSTVNLWFNDETGVDSANAVKFSTNFTNATYYASADHVKITSVANGADTLKLEVMAVMIKGLQSQ